MTKINLNNLKLTVGEKYTILKPNNLLPECLQFTLVNYYIGDYAQHENQLFLIVKFKGHRKLSRVVIANETAFIFKGWNFTKNWSKEKVSETMAKLHRITLDQVKNNKDFIYNISMGDSFTTENDILSFVDYTTDFLIDAGIRGAEQLKHEGYYNYIKQLLREKSYNINEVEKQCKAWDYIHIVTLLDKIKKEWY